MATDFTLEDRDVSEAQAAIAGLKASSARAPAHEPKPADSPWRVRYRTLLLWVVLVAGFVVFWQLKEAGKQQPPGAPPAATAPPTGPAAPPPLHWALAAAAACGVVALVSGVLMVRRAQSHRPQQRIRPALGAEGLELHSEGVVRTLRWPAILRVEQSPSAILVEVEHMGWHVLPRRAFEGDEAETFLRELRSKAGTKPTPAPASAEGSEEEKEGKDGDEGETRLEFTLAPEEIVEGARGMSRRILALRTLRSADWRAQVGFTASLAGSAVAGVSCAGLALLGSAWWALPALACFLFLFLGLRLVLKPALGGAEIERYRTLAFQLRFDPRRVELSWEGGSVSLAWSAVRGSWEGRSVFLLWDLTSTSFVPKRAFATPEQLSRFRELLAGRGRAGT